MNRSLYELCGQSLFWDDSTTWNIDCPEIPECFQKTVLVWIPSAFLFVGIPIEIYLLSDHKRSAIPWNILSITKLIIGIVLILATIGDFLLQFHDSSEQGVSPVNTIGSVFLMCNYVVMIFHVVVARIKGISSSWLVFFFWLIITLCFGLSYITLWWKIIAENRLPQPHSYIYNTVAFTLCVSQLVLSSFADTSPFYADDKECPEVNASVPSKLSFSWFDSLVFLGYRRPLKQDDLWSLQPKLTSEVNCQMFEEQWDKEVERKKRRHLRTTNTNSFNLSPKKTEYPTVLFVLWKIYGVFFVAVISIRLISDCMFIVSPLMLRKIIAHLEEENDPSWHGYFYALVIFFSGIIQYVMLEQHMLHCQIIGVRMRAALISAIYKKALRMSSSAKSQSTVGEIVNLMGVDTQRVLEATLELGGLFSTPLQIFIAVYLLWGLFGIASLAGVGAMCIILPVNMIVLHKVKALQRSVMKFKDERVKLVNEIFNGIKVLKLYAWELSFYELIQKIREKELKIIRSANLFQCIVVLSANCTPFVIALVIFTTYVMIDDNNVLDASKAFVSISVLFLLKVPFLTLPAVLVKVIQAVISVKRIQGFMRSTDIDPAAVKHEPNESFPIFISNGSFAWSEDEDSILRDIEFVVPQGHLIAIVGPVGAGKSSLLSAVLGEMIKRTGHVNTQGRIAYVPQQAWLQNATLRNNILLGKMYEKRIFDQVVEACALDPDIEMLPAGDLTEIGEKGINLSGGQKQRVSLARAVYNDADLYLLDDPLSAVDAHVGKQLFEKVIGPQGILKKKTRILVTHNLVYLAEVDSIVFLSNGKITEAGTYEELMEKKGSFADLMNSYNSSQKDNKSREEDIEISNLKRQISRQWSELSQTSHTWSEGSCISDMDCTSLQEMPVETVTNYVLKRQMSYLQESGKLTKAEEIEEGQVNWRIYAHYIRNMSVPLLLISLGFYITSWASSVGSNIWLRDWSTDNESESQEIQQRNLRLGVYFTFGVTQAICIYLAAVLITLAVLRATKQLHNQLLLSLLHATMSFFDTTPLGRIISRFSRDIDVMDLVMPHVVRPTVNNTTQLISIIIVVVIGAPIILAVGTVMSILCCILQRVYITTARELKRLESASRSPIYSHFSETISGLTTLRAYRMQDAFIAESMKRVDINHEALFPGIAVNRWMALRLNLISGTVIFFTIIFILMRRDAIDIGTVGLTITYAMQLTYILSNVVRVYTELENTMVAIERIRQYSQVPSEAPWEIPQTKPPPLWPEEGTLLFRHYSTTYRKGLQLILKDISCDIHSGEKIGIVGRTGAGKSSLTLALFRIIEATEGSIFIDGREIGEMGLHDLRSKLTIIPQDPVLFSCSLRTNLDPFEEYSDQQIWKALELAHLKSYVTSLSGGLLYQVAEGGENLSVGQRQLLCLARALLRKTKILILDEATASVDVETDDIIQATIRREFADCTVLTIAHRLNTIMDSTRILVLDKGSIEEFDTPTNLLDNENSLFYSMVKEAGLI